MKRYIVKKLNCYPGLILRDISVIALSFKHYGFIMKAGTIVLLSFILPAIIMANVWRHNSNLSGNQKGFTKADGRWTLSIMRFLLPKHAFENIVQNAIADMWDQQQEALANGEVWRYRWIGVRDQTRIILALAIEPVSKVLFKIVSGTIPRS